MVWSGCVAARRKRCSAGGLPAASSIPSRLGQSTPPRRRRAPWVSRASWEDVWGVLGVLGYPWEDVLGGCLGGLFEARALKLWSV